MNIFAALDINSKKSLLRLLIDSVVKDKDTIYINLIGSQKYPRCYSSRSNS